MNPNDVIDAYVVEVMRGIPRKDRNDIGLELRALLGEMLAGRAADAGRTPDDAMVLAMLREFGTPAEVAARYTAPGIVIIPPEQARSFTLATLLGVGLQWALSLPEVFDGRKSAAAWWLSWGLGALWWPGFMATLAMIAAWWRWFRSGKDAWSPKVVDPERVSRPVTVLGLAWFAIGVATLAFLPWIVGAMPGKVPEVLALDPGFLRGRAWPALGLFAVQFALLVRVLREGRWSPAMRRLESMVSVGWVALLAWWLWAGRMFVAQPTDDGARGGIALVLLFVLGDLAYKLIRGRTRIRMPEGANGGG